jgi:hypothetical protein
MGLCWLRAELSRRDYRDDVRMRHRIVTVFEQRFAG